VDFAWQSIEHLSPQLQIALVSLWLRGILLCGLTGREGMRARLQIVLVLAVLGVVIAVPLCYAVHHNTHMRNFAVVEEGVLYRSGQLTPEALDQVVKERNIRTVVTLRSTRVIGKLPPDTWEEKYCESNGLKHVRIVPRVWGADEKGEVPAEQAVQEFLRVMDDPTNYPVLVHCFAGIHRTGMMCAVFRMEYRHWPVEKSINEMHFYGYEDLTEDVEGYLRSYVPRQPKR
jgi:tyrosine-protein phosphatase SIW14